MPGQQFCGEDIGPEGMVLPKGYLGGISAGSCGRLSKTNLQLDRICMISLACEHCHGVMENIAPSLHSLIEPACPMSFLVEWYSESLSTAVIHGIDQVDFEFVGVLG